ncbi:hypothetical protein KCU65_g471, partial [Aureobasidium melanogenum]
MFVKHVMSVRTTVATIKSLRGSPRWIAVATVLIISLIERSDDVHVLRPPQVLCLVCKCVDQWTWAQLCGIRVTCFAYPNAVGLRLWRLSWWG